MTAMINLSEKFRLSCWLCCLALIACTNRNESGASAQDAPARWLPILFFADDGMTRLYRASVPPRIGSEFPLLTGAFTGSPSVETGLQFVSDPAGITGFRPEAAIPTVAEAVTSRNLSSLTDGMNLVPAETRFGRFGSFSWNEADGESFGTTGFIDLRTGNHLLLTYFDRRCRISGSTLLGGSELWRYQIIIPDAGLHWIEIIPEKVPDIYRLQRTDDRVQPALAIVMEHGEQLNAGLTPAG